MSLKIFWLLHCSSENKNKPEILQMTYHNSFYVVKDWKIVYGGEKDIVS